MIYTITTNPSLDYYLTFDKDIKLGGYNRSILEMFDSGGKGVNVSIFLNALGIHSTCLGFVGGFTKDFYLEHLKKYKYLTPNFTFIKDNTRINIKLMSNEESSLNSRGPAISNDEFDKFSSRLNKLFDAEFLIVSGNIQNELEDKLADSLNSAIDEGVKVVLDTEPCMVNKIIAKKPYAVKLNERIASSDEKTIIEYSKDLVSKGAKYVLYSSVFNKDYYLINADKILKITRDENIYVHTGSGDSMIAGFLYSKLRGADDETAFKYGVSTSCQLHLSDDITDRSSISDFANSLKVTKL